MNKKMFDLRQTMVIADFDGTFTKKGVKGQKGAALMDVLRDEKYLGKEGLQASKDLFNQYYPIEIDPHIDRPEKVRLMQEWWEKSFATTKKYGVTKDILLEVCRSPLLEWRTQLLDFLKLLDKEGVPLIIFSAGDFGNLAIKYLLGKDNALTPNIQILSNEIIFGDDGALLEIAKPIIHIANKTGQMLIDNNLLSETPERRQCLLIGDGLDDIKMIEGINFDSTYKVAFGSYNLEHFKQLFDLVLPIDGSYGPIIDLLN